MGYLRCLASHWSVPVIKTCLLVDLWMGKVVQSLLWFVCLFIRLYSIDLHSTFNFESWAPGGYKHVGQFCHQVKNMGLHVLPIGYTRRPINGCLVVLLYRGLNHWQTPMPMTTRAINAVGKGLIKLTRTNCIALFFDNLSRNFYSIHWVLGPSSVPYNIICGYFFLIKWTHSDQWPSINHLFRRSKE